MSKPEWEKRKPGEPGYEGVRAAGWWELGLLSPGDQLIVDTVLEAMAWCQLIIFRYGESDRVVAPFVVGVSSEGNALMRGYQVEGVSKSGKGPGWRVYQIKKMEKVANYFEFFNVDDFDFDEFYPWTYKVFKML